MLHCDLPVYDPAPDMFLNERTMPVAYSGSLIPPRLEIAKTIYNSDVTSFHAIRDKVIREFKRDISKIAKAFLKGGMRTVIVSFYPVVAMADSSSEKRRIMVARGEYAIVAYRDKRKFGKHSR